MNEITTISDPATPAPKGKAWRVTNLHKGDAHMTLSTQWFSRPADQKFLSLDALREFKQKEFEASTAIVIKAKQIEAMAPEPTEPQDLNRLSFGLPNGSIVASSHWGFSQLCGLINFPAKHYREKMPAQLTAADLNWGFHNHRTVEDTQVYYTSNLVAAQDNEASNLLRAASGADYGRVPDYQVVEALQQAIAGQDWKVPGVMDWQTMIYDPHTPVTLATTTLFASDSDLFIFLVDDLNPIEIGKVLNKTTGLMEPDILFRGFYITNSEVGKSSLRIATFYLRALCCNRIMWGVEGFEELTIRHTKYALDRWMHEAQPALESYAQKGTQRLLQAVEAAKQAKVAEDQKQAVAFLAGLGHSKQRAERMYALVETEEGHPATSVWDMAQGITAFARDVVNTDDRLAIEGTARVILDKVAA